jgi:hypothetical protein
VRKALAVLNSERGHVGSTVPSLVAVAATIVTAIGIGRDSHVVEIIGVVLFGLTMAAAIQAPRSGMGGPRRLSRTWHGCKPFTHNTAVTTPGRFGGPLSLQTLRVDQRCRRSYTRRLR